MPSAKKITELPAPVLKSEISLEETISKRRSKRSYSDKDLTLQQVSQILWACQGITNDRGYRAVPSAGALYPLEIYAVKRDGLYHYEPKGHRLNLLEDKDLRGALKNAAWGQSFIGQVPMNIVICAVYSRITSRYGDRGIKYTDMEAGHAGQNIALQAVGLGLGTVMVGAFETEKVSELLNLPKDQEPLYIIPVGYTK